MVWSLWSDFFPPRFEYVKIINVIEVITTISPKVRQITPYHPRTVSNAPPSHTPRRLSVWLPKARGASLRARSCTLGATFAPRPFVRARTRSRATRPTWRTLRRAGGHTLQRGRTQSRSRGQTVRATPLGETRSPRATSIIRRVRASASRQIDFGWLGRCSPAVASPNRQNRLRSTESRRFP